MFNREPVLHIVKSWSYLFTEIALGNKRHDIRDMRDRDYQVGDLLNLEEFDMASGAYTGLSLTMRITYITNRDTPCAFSSSVLDRNFAILSLAPLDAT